MKLDERRKSTKLFRVGQSALHSYVGESGEKYGYEAAVYAMACMLDEAINGPKRAKAREKKPPLLFDGPSVHKYLQARCPETFIYEPVEASWWARLNRGIRDLEFDEDLSAEDILSKLADYCRSGAYGSWKKKTDLPFEFLVNNFKNWTRTALSTEQREVASTHTFFRPKGR